MKKPAKPVTMRVEGGAVLHERASNSAQKVQTEFDSPHIITKLSTNNLHGVDQQVARYLLNFVVKLHG